LGSASAENLLPGHVFVVQLWPINVNLISFLLLLSGHWIQSTRTAWCNSPNANQLLTFNLLFNLPISFLYTFFSFLDIPYYFLSACGLCVNFWFSIWLILIEIGYCKLGPVSETS
jgi:hypothetical protein